MQIASFVFGIAFFVAAFWIYVRVILSTRKLVEEAGQLYPHRTFSCWFWIYAWKPHSAAAPESPVRREIVRGFLMCWLFMILGLACVVFSMQHGLALP